jgi:hypothetical protein
MHDTGGPTAIDDFTPDKTAHGPFEGDHAAAGYAPRLAAADPTVVATGPAALHPTDQPAVPEDAWGALPAEIAVSAHATPGADAPVTVLVLLDRTRAVAAAVGPFDDPAAADAWRPPRTPDPRWTGSSSACTRPRPPPRGDPDTSDRGSRRLSRRTGAAPPHDARSTRR